MKSILSLVVSLFMSLPSHALIINGKDMSHSDNANQVISVLNGQLLLRYNDNRELVEQYPLPDTVKFIDNGRVAQINRNIFNGEKLIKNIAYDDKGNELNTVNFKLMSNGLIKSAQSNNYIEKRYYENSNKINHSSVNGDNIYFQYDTNGKLIEYVMKSDDVLAKFQYQNNVLISIDTYRNNKLFSTQKMNYTKDGVISGMTVHIEGDIRDVSSQQIYIYKK